jgi:hypothetical protein
MQKRAARCLARYYRRLGVRCRIARHAAPGGGTFWNVRRVC